MLSHFTGRGWTAALLALGLLGRSAGDVLAQEPPAEPTQEQRTLRGQGTLGPLPHQVPFDLGPQEAAPRGPDERITIEADDEDLRSVIQRIAKVSDANILIGSDVPRGLRVSLRLRGIPIKHALRAVARAVGMVVLHPDADEWIVRNPANAAKFLETRVFRLRGLLPLTVEIEGKSRVVIPARMGDKMVDLLAQIARGLTKGADGTPVGGVDYDLVTNSIIVVDIQPKLDDIEQILGASAWIGSGQSTQSERLKRLAEGFREAHRLLKQLEQRLAAALKELEADARQREDDLEELLRRRQQELRREYYEKVRRSRGEAPEGPGKERGGK